MKDDGDTIPVVYRSASSSGEIGLWILLDGGEKVTGKGVELVFFYFCFFLFLRFGLLLADTAKIYLKVPHLEMGICVLWLAGLGVVFSLLFAISVISNFESLLTVYYILCPGLLEGYKGYVNTPR